MKHLHLGLAAVACLSLCGIAAGRADAALPSACAVLPLADIRALLGSPVAVSYSRDPTQVRGGYTVATCSYSVPRAAGRAATITLEQGPVAGLMTIKKHYDEKPGLSAASMRGDMLVLASVHTTSPAGAQYDAPGSAKLLAAVLKKV